MTRKMRRSQFSKICKTVHGLHLGRYGVPYGGAAGVILPEHLDEMLSAVENFKELHIVSYFEVGRGQNRYIENADYYKLSSGDKDPEVEFTAEISLADSTEEEIDCQIHFIESIKAESLEGDPVVIAGMNWLRKKLSKAS